MKAFQIIGGIHSPFAIAFGETAEAAKKRYNDWLFISYGRRDEGVGVTEMDETHVCVLNGGTTSFPPGMKGPIDLKFYNNECQVGIFQNDLGDQCRRCADAFFGNVCTLTGEQIEESGNWSAAAIGEWSMTLFVQSPNDRQPTIRKLLSVHFKPGLAVIDHANLDGEEVDGSQNWSLPA